MKLNLIKSSLLASLALSIAFTSCKKDETPEPPKPPVIAPTDTLVELSGSLTTQTLDATKKYLLKGIVVIDDNITLTIPAGTVLFGEKKTKGTLLVKKGGKLIAEGTEAKPIVMTSNQEPGERDKGDWGGVVVLGKANVNQNNPAIEGITPAANFGTFQSTANDADNSGIIKYVRIEYAGIALTPNNETNSLTMGGVGSGTTIEYVQVTYGGDDGFEWFGGTVNGKYLISYGTWDDDFDVDFGHSGKIQFGLAVRDPFAADQSGSNGFEVDNDASGTTATPKTSAVFSNMTILGPSYDSSSRSSFSGNYQHALHLRRNSEISILNSVIAGFPIGLNLDGTLPNYISGAGVLDKNILVSSAVRGRVARPFFNGSSASTAVQDYFLTTKSNLTFNETTPRPTATTAYAKAFDDAGIPVALVMGYSTVAGTTGDYPQNPNFATFTGATQSGAAFTDAKVSSWFTSTTFRGAFGTTDWTDTWSNFNPQNIAY
ncbi:MAG: hypothetical protein Q8K70_07695 [Bacteroidota bacterium]|nr:hypothetical protein [Bacteroidota bacterium]